MKKPQILFFLFWAFHTALFSQNTLRVSIKDAVTREPLPGATVKASGIPAGALSGDDGVAVVQPLPDGPVQIVCSYVGYQPDTLSILLPQRDAKPLEILLRPVESDVEEVVISSTRTNARIEDLPVKVEVLGQEELDEEVSLVPGGMGSLLGDLSVITIQRTNPVNGNDAVRMQGLDPGYTQLLQDGLPLYEGFSGSLGVLAIPPLDLRQVEIIKGSSSTLYGGSAIGGLINFISRAPEEKPRTTFLFNQTTLGETDLNAFVSRRLARGNGFTLLAAGDLKQPRDVNGDGFAEVPRNRSLLVHPRYFFNAGKNTTGNLGVTYSATRLDGGDFEAVKNRAADAAHPYYEQDNSKRTTLAGQLQSRLSETATLTLKSTASLFRRSGMYAGFDFGGRQISSYSEANMLWKKGAHTLVAGTNLVSENFKKESGDAVPFADYQNITTGLFAQYDWQIAPKFALETGLRTDHHNRFGWRVLPRAGIFYKPAPPLSIRLAYGAGYKNPDIFSAAEPVEYRLLQPLAAGVAQNLAHSLNMDAGYHALLWEKVGFQINQALYYTRLEKPFVVAYDAAGNISLENAPWRASSIGTDTYIQLDYSGIELYLGYNHTLSEQHRPGGDVRTPFNPQNKFAMTLAYDIPGKWRMGVESALSANQYVEANRRVPDFWFFAVMIARQFKWGSVVLNCENAGDSRQAKHEALVTGTRLNPVFTPVWGPVEGRVVNLSVKVAL